MANTQSEYYDPDTGFIWINNSVDGGSISANTTEGTELGLQNTQFDDVKIKILTVEYRIMIYVSNTNDWNTQGFAGNRDAYGQCFFGVSNQLEHTPSQFGELEGFTGTSAFPVRAAPWAVVCGQTVTISKTWRPDKMAFSNEQCAFISILNASSSAAAPTWFGGITIRAVRL